MKAITDRLRLPAAITPESGRYIMLGLMMLGSWWAAEHFRLPGEDDRKPEPGKIDYYSKGLQRTVMDDTGKPKEFLVVDELVHYEGDNHSDLANPVMTLYVKDGPPWVIHSETAMVTGDGNEVFLRGNVLVTREANKNGRTMRVQTTNARVQPDRKYAETDEDILVISPPDTMTGTGAKLNFGDDLHYTILSNARRKHDVETP